MSSGRGGPAAAGGGPAAPGGAPVSSGGGGARASGGGSGAAAAAAAAGVEGLRLSGGEGEAEARESVYEAVSFEGDPGECGHTVTTAATRKDGSRSVLRYAAERVVGNGSFGVVFQATCLETRETVAIKRVLQDKRFKNRELQIMRLLDHPNVVKLKQSFYSTQQDKDEVYLNLVLEFVPDTVYRIIKHYAKRAQARGQP